jgi:hypothetical protein
MGREGKGNAAIIGFDYADDDDWPMAVICILHLVLILTLS